MAEKIPLNEVLTAIDNKDFNWYAGLTEEKKKEWGSWLFLRYASTGKGKDKDELILNTNEFVNKHYVDIYKHEELIWKLFCLTGTGKKQFHEWIKPPNAKIKKDPITQFVLGLFPDMKGDEIELFQHINGADGIKQMALDLGMSDKEISDIFGKTKKPRKKKK